ncbi:TonB family protein [Desulfuromonas acetoxidans]|uniref:energy transducer TonB n=1 Tax=Desulfuromonas acetoxidans TaxID=891 RepID=UPI00293068CB|nr:TonB family protein [Desulfuromonas acetoxidans]
MNRTFKSSAVMPYSWLLAVKAILVAMVPLCSSGSVGLGVVKSTGLSTFLTLSAVVHVGLYSLLAVPAQTPQSVEAQPITLVSFAPSAVAAAPVAAQPVVPVTEPVTPPPVVAPPKPVERPKVVEPTVPVIKTTIEKQREPEPPPAPRKEEVAVKPEVLPEPPVAAAAAVANVAEQVQGPSMVSASAEQVVDPVPGMAMQGERMATELERYVMLVQQQVQAHLHYPLKARKWHIEGKGKFQFEIAADGSLTDNNVMVLTSCGRRMLDRAAIHTIRHAAPFAAPPQGALTVTAPIIFELR